MERLDAILAISGDYGRAGVRVEWPIAEEESQWKSKYQPCRQVWRFMQRGGAFVERPSRGYESTTVIDKLGYRG